jgi:DNA-binding HxlR family transcriptional regulator
MVQAVSSGMLVTRRNHSGETAVELEESTPEDPREHHEATCGHISRMLARISDKWTLLVVRSLGNGPLRFNALRRDVGEVSQKMLTATLRQLEENGFVTRTVTPTTPPQVEYALTDLGRDLKTLVQGLAEWVVTNSALIDAARAAYAARQQQEAQDPVRPDPLISHNSA